MFDLCLTQIDLYLVQAKTKGMATAKVTLRKSKKRADGKCPITLRITKERKSSYIHLEWIEEKYWDEVKNKVKNAHPNSKRLNNFILKKLAEADDLILEAESNKKFYTASQLSQIIKGNRKNKYFVEYAREFIVDLEKMNKISRAKADNSRINNFFKFLKGKDIPFQQIDEALLKKFRVYMISDLKNSERSVMNAYVVIRTIFNKAIQEGIVEQKYYPFGKGKIQIKFPQTSKIGLEEQEVKAIENLDLEFGSTIWHTRNLFLFSLNLAGVRVSDVLRMKWSDLEGGRLYYQMGKNNKVDSLKLSSKVIGILEYYKADKQNEQDFIFPELKKANLNNPKDVYNKINTASKKFNKYLAKIAERADITKKITNHISRHTFGNIAGDKISPQMLQKLYRHSNLTTTIGYQGNFIHKDADEALDSVINF